MSIVETEPETIHCKFEMSLWQRIVTGFHLWWGVIKGEIDCFDDETPSEAQETQENTTK